MRYKVYRYDVSDEPAGDAPRLYVECETVEEALSVARRIIENSLAEQLQGATSADDLYDRFSCFGEGALIHGEPDVPWHVYEYAQEKAKEIFKKK